MARGYHGCSGSSRISSDLKIKNHIMRAHIFQHMPFEKPGSIEPLLRKAGYDISFTFFYENSDIPLIDDIDFLIIMGGSMSVNDEGNVPWLVKEKQFIRDFIATDKPVLGICLGSQLIASALGAKVYPNKEKEIGWFSVTGLKAPQISNFQFPASLTPLHWHGETFDLPEGAVLLASSEACKNQAFQLGKNVLAIQFHPEATLEIVENFVFHFRNELVPGRFIQDDKEILSLGNEYLPLSYELIQNLLNFLLVEK
jgi:GMP synthase-like glutamine amidotransferase